jgi:hypothetical protein
MTDVSAIYRQGLEEEIIAKLAEARHMNLSDAMDTYYRSRLARQIANGDFGIQYLSAAYLVEDLIANEPDLFCKENSKVGSQ